MAEAFERASRLQRGPRKFGQSNLRFRISDLRCAKRKRDSAQPQLAKRKRDSAQPQLKICPISKLPISFQSTGNVFVYRLPFVVIFRMADPVRPRDGLRGFIRLEPYVPFLMLLRAIPLPKPVVAKHQVVMSLQVLRVN